MRSKCQLWIANCVRSSWEGAPSKLPEYSRLSSSPRKIQSKKSLREDFVENLFKLSQSSQRYFGRFLHKSSRPFGSNCLGTGFAENEVLVTSGHLRAALSVGDICLQPSSPPILKKYPTENSFCKKATMKKISSM